MIEKEVLKREPYVSEKVVCALWAPSAAVINPWEYAIAFAEIAALNGTEFIFNFKVADIKKTGNGYSIISDNKTIEAKYVINAAGIFSDKIHNMVADPIFKVIPSKGNTI